MPRRVAMSIIEEIGATRPGMANLTLKVMRRLFAYAIKKDRVTTIHLSASSPTGLAPITLGRTTRSRPTKRYGPSARVSGWPLTCYSIPDNGSVMLPRCVGLICVMVQSTLSPKRPVTTW